MNARAMETTPGEAFDAFLAAGDVRRGLPAAAYNSEAFHAAENERLFAKSWVPVGFVHEMPQRGDVRPVTAAGQPLLLVRTEGGAIRAFHNSCRHRCLQLVAAAGNSGKLIRCPYHSWAYDLEGRLRATPAFGGAEDRPAGFRREDNGLVGVRCEVWHDWIFVNIDGAAAPFAEFIAPLAAHTEGFDLSALKPVAVLDFGIIETNWKFLIENFVEPYHVPFVHATTTDQPLRHHAPFIDGHCIGCKVKVGDAARADAEVLAVDSDYMTLFPNFVLSAYAPDQIGMHLDTPLGAGQTHQRRAIYLLREGDIADAEVEGLKKLWGRVHREDHAMCERLQRGRASPLAADGGWLSPHWERSVRRFQELIYAALAADTAPNTDLFHTHSTEAAHESP